VTQSLAKLTLWYDQDEAVTLEETGTLSDTSGSPTKTIKINRAAVSRSDLPVDCTDWVAVASTDGDADESYGEHVSGEVVDVTGGMGTVALEIATGAQPVIFP